MTEKELLETSMNELEIIFNMTDEDKEFVLEVLEDVLGVAKDIGYEQGKVDGYEDGKHDGYKLGYDDGKYGEYG